MRALSGRWGVLSGLGIQVGRDIPSLGSRQDFRTGKWIFPNLLFPAGPEKSHTILITDGLVRLTAVTAGSQETILSIHGPGDLLGEQDAIRGLLRDWHPGPATTELRMAAVALTPVEARAIPPAAMTRFLAAHPEVLAAVSLELCERLEEAGLRIASSRQDNADRRLARLLCDLECYGRPYRGSDGVAGTRIPVTLSHAELASWIGACSETAGRALRRWRDRQIVTARRGDIIVQDLEALARIAGVRLSRQAWNWQAAAGS